MSQVIIKQEYDIVAGDYASAGHASANIKRFLKQLGIEGNTVRRVAVASYEVELNIAIHSLGGKLLFEVTSSAIKLSSVDKGPGIPNIELAMQEGYSTADEEARSLGFGAGMGLPNMKRNASKFSIKSEMGVGTTICMEFAI